MAIERILVLGNRDIARSIVGALTVYSPEEGFSTHRVAVVTYPYQKPYLPAQVAAESVEHKVSDFSLASLEKAFAGQDLVISTVSGGDYELQSSIVEAVIAAGVKRFIPHEFGQDTLKPKVHQRTRRGSEHAKLIQLLQSRQSVLEWVAVAVGCVLNSLLLSGDLGFDLAWQSGSIHGYGDEVFPVSSLDRVGIVVKEIIRHWEEVKNQYMYAAGALISADKLVDSLERASESKWSVGYSDVEDCIREGEARKRRGFLDSGMLLLERSILYDRSLRAADAFMHHSANNILGLEEENLDDIVDKTYHTFKRYGKSNCGCDG